MHAIATDLTYYVALANGYWGRGKTEEEALKQCRKAGANKRELIIIYRNEITADLVQELAEKGITGDSLKPTVDGYGNIGYYGEKCKVAEWKNGKRTEVSA